MSNVMKIVNRETGVAFNMRMEDFHISIVNGRFLVDRSEVGSIINTQTPLGEIKKGSIQSLFKDGNKTEEVVSKIGIMSIGDVIEVCDCEDEHHTVRMIMSKYAKKNARKYKTKSIDNTLYVKRIQ